MALTSSQLDTITRTVLGEANANDPAGEAAVASVIKNRSESGLFPSDPAAVATQGTHGTYHQFSAWNPISEQGNNEVNITSGPRYDAVAQVVQGVFDGSISDPTNGATYYHENGTSAPQQTGSMYKTADIGGQSFYSPTPVPPADIPDPVTPQDPPLAYGMNDSGGPDDRSADPNYYPPSVTPVPLALASSAGATPVPLAPIQQTVQIGNSTYVVGQSYQTADGAAFTANADGTFTKSASTPRAETPIQLAMDIGNPNSMLSQTISSAKALPGQVMGAGPAIGSAASSIGQFFGSLFGNKTATQPVAAAPIVSAVPNAPAVTSTDLAPLMNFSGSPDDRQSTPVPSLPNPYQAPSGPLNYSGSPDDRNYQTPPSSSITSSHSASSNPLDAGDDGGWGDFFSGAASMNSAPVTSAHSSTSLEDDGPLNYQSGPDTTVNASGSPDDRDSAFSTNYGAAAAAVPQTIAKQIAVANPAYKTFLDSVNTDPYSDANFDLATPWPGSTPSAAKAPPKTVLQTIGVANPAYKPQQAFAPAVTAPIASTNGYTYLPNGSGGYTRAGSVNPSLSPSQQYALAAAPALNDGNPDGSRPTGGTFVGNSGGQGAGGGSLV